MLFYASCCSSSHLDKVSVRSFISVRLRNCAAVIFLDHGYCSAYEVSEVVCEVEIKSVEHNFICVKSILAKRVLSEQEILERIYAVSFDKLYRVYYISS